MFKKRVMAVALSIVMMPAMCFTSFAGEEGPTVRAPNGKALGISGINRPVQAADELILFTRENSSELTDTNSWCAAATAEYTDGRYVISAMDVRTGAVKIPYNGFVLFGHGTSEQWILDNLEPGDAVEIDGYGLPEVVDGAVLLLENGAKRAVDGVDRERQNDGLLIYTMNYGEFTGAFGDDTEEVIVANGIVVEKNTDGSGGTYIPGNGYVICGTGSARSFVGDMETGQKVTLVNVDVPVLPARYFIIEDRVVPIDRENAPRGANEVVVYDPSYGASTRTNPWGMEITVEDGRVTAVVGITSEDGVFIDNDSPIPQDGYVLSIQSGNAFYGLLDGNVKTGDAVTLVLNNTYIYNADKTAYAAMNPRSREDNPPGWDDAADSPYPGFRGADQLILYDSSYGSTTGTNAWGYEVVVNEDNKVIKAGGNNSGIPEGGLVLSGHGAKADWLRNTAVIGSRVRVDTSDKTCLVLLTPEALLDGAAFRINEAGEELEASRAKFLDLPYEKIQAYISKAAPLIQAAENHLVRKNYRELLDIIRDIDGYAERARFSSYESRKVENRAVWIRPKETSAAQVANILDNLKDLNINTVYLETWWGGYTIFPTENEITEQNPMYEGFDVLKAYIEEGRARGMEIHGWVENFFIGDSGTRNGGPVYAKKPEWLLLSRKGDNFQYVDMYDINYYFANPALPEVRDFIMEIYAELVKKYDIDGLQLDYVRYPEVGDGTNDFGYDPYTRELFEKESGTDPMNVRPGDELWEKWCEFRANIINTFVYRVVSEVRALKPEIRISADVWPNYAQGPTAMMQEPAKWVTKGYIDNIIPMSYTPDVDSTREDAVNTLAFAGGHSYVTMGLGTYLGLSGEVLLGQMRASNDSGAHGTALFEYESLMSAGYGDGLKEGLYRNGALVCDKDPLASVNVILRDVIRKLNDIYLPYKGIERSEAGKLSDRLSGILKSVKAYSNAGIDPSKAADLKGRISRLMDEVKKSRRTEEEVKSRITADLESCGGILTNYIERESFAKRQAVEEFVLEIPADGAKVGDILPVKVKAVFKAGEDVIMYLDPSQYTITSSNTRVAQVRDGSVMIKGRGRAEITVKISKNFIYNSDKKDRLIKRELEVR